MVVFSLTSYFSTIIKDETEKLEFIGSKPSLYNNINDNTIQEFISPTASSSFSSQTFQPVANELQISI